MLLRNIGCDMSNKYRFLVFFVFLLSTSESYAQKLGKYIYQSGQITGEMNVMDVAACDVSNKLGCISAVRPIKIHIKTIDIKGNDCDVDAIEETAGRIQSQGKLDIILVIDDAKSQTKPNLSVSFAGDEAIVMPSESGSGIGCGAGAHYDGRWQLKKTSLKLPEKANSSAQSNDLFSRCMDLVDAAAMKNTQFAACYSAELNRNDTELNKTYSELRSKLDAQRQKLLLQGQRAWIGYRDAWCGFEESSDQAPSPQVNKLDCLVQITKSQIVRIRRFSQ